MIYYYVLSNKIKSTNIIDEYINLILNNQITLITDKQRVELKLPLSYLSDLKKEISLYENRVPLYDIKSNNIFLINKSNVYRRIFHDKYRFVDKHFYKDLLELKNPSISDKQNIQILSFYDINTLYQTYLQIFYDSFVSDEYITSCKRPSFQPGMDHIKPYYKSDEIYYLAYDWNLTDHATLEADELRSLCKKIQIYDIPAKILLDHQMYIYDNKAIGLIKHYSLFGSYFINRYLRNYKCCIMEDPDESIIITKNPILENQIKLMIKLIKSAPEFTQSYTVYRFIDIDTYLSHLIPGDIYTDPSFLSTTRDPVYYQSNYSFGYILIKIKLPQHIQGIGLCIESYSNFPEEQEIILPPTSRYRLIKVTTQTEKYHNIIKLNQRIQKKYEFELIDNAYINTDEIIFKNDKMKSPIITNIDFKDLRADEDIVYTSISDRLENFTKNYLNVNSQFSSIIGKTEFIFVIESYDSTSAYKQFFSHETSSGIMCYSSNPKYGNINIMLELGLDIDVNFYFKFSISDSGQQLDLTRTEWIDWLSLFAYVIGSRFVIIHSKYVLLPDDKDDDIITKQNKTRYTFSDNIYQYLKNGKKMFDTIIGMSANFDYEQLDILAGTHIDDIIKLTDIDELYQIAIISKQKNVKDLYLYIIENEPQYIKLMETKIENIYSPDVNPFLNISYKLNPWAYLLEKQLINNLPLEKDFSNKKGSFKKLIGNKKIPQFKNRLRSYLYK